MSGIFGIFNRNGQEAEPIVVDRLLGAMSSWQPDEIHAWAGDSAALGHGMLWNTPESRFEHLPLQQDMLVLTMDARLDNREELAEKLHFSDQALAETGDSAFILAAYKKWGGECPKHLLGDFAFAIWDRNKKLLFCARDHVGVKQLYYHLSDTLFAFANDLAILTAHPLIAKTINEQAVANYIVNHELLSNSLTFFEEIVKLPPAHTLTVTGTRAERKCYWRLKDAATEKLADAEAYSSKLRELLEQAVHARMRSSFPITSHLSGGLDSSSIAVISAKKLRQKGEKLLAFNWLHQPGKGDDPSHDEWANSKVIAKAEDIEHHYVELTAEKIYEWMTRRDIAYGETETFWYEYPIREAAQQKDSRTILSGWGGDEIVTYHGLSFFIDLFLHGHWILLHHEICRRLPRSGNRLKALLGHYYFKVLLPLLPRKIQPLMPRTHPPGKKFTLAAPAMAAKVRIEEDKSTAADLSMCPNRTIRAHKLAYWNHGHIQSRIESWAAAAWTARLNYSYPLLDKRILEFAMAIPAKYYINKKEARWISRKAVQDLLPENILSVHKIEEPERVSTNIAQTGTVFNKFVQSRPAYSGKAMHIDLEKTYLAIEELADLKPDRTFLEQMDDIESALLILQSKTLQGLS